MPFPDLADLMPAILRALVSGEGPSHRIRNRLCNDFELSPEERSFSVLSDSRPFFEIQVDYAILYLSQAQLIRSGQDGKIHITDRGRDVLADGPPRMDFAFLLQFKEFRAFAERVAGVNWPADPLRLPYPD